MVEVVRIFGDALQSLRQLWLLEDVARLVEVAVALKDSMRFGKLRQVGIVERSRGFVIEDVAITRQSYRGLHHLLQRELAPMLLREYQAGHRTGDADRFVAQRAHAWDNIALGIQIHVGGSFGRGFLAEVEEVYLAIGPAKEQEAASTDVACLGKHHGKGEADGNRGVYCVAALPHDCDARLGCLGLQGGHHGLRRMHRMHSVAGESLGAKSQRKYHLQQLASQLHKDEGGRTRIMAAQMRSAQEVTAMQVQNIEASPARRGESNMFPSVE